MKQIGLRYNRLVVTGLHSRDAKGNARWLCQCDCGNTTVSLTHHLKNKHAQSCGCYGEELKKAASKKAKNERRKSTRKSYKSMIARCFLEKTPAYSRYGAMGITVCDRWRFGENEKSGWECFYADMGPRPKNTSLDRICPFGDYHPLNCRWATGEEQRANRKTNHPLCSKELPCTPTPS